MKQGKLIAVFAVVAAIQLAVPALMIQEREWILSGGRAFRFPVAPVDPYDAFRGRFVAINFQGLDLPAPEGRAARRGQRVYAGIAEREDGTASFTTLSLKPPKEGDYLAVRVKYASDRVTFETPFDRFYLDEELAPEAELAYRAHASATAGDAFVILRVRGGRGAIEDLVIGDMPIRRAAQERMEKP